MAQVDRSTRKSLEQNQNDSLQKKSFQLDSINHSQRLISITDSTKEKFTLAYPWQSLKNKNLEFVMVEKKEYQAGLSDFFVRKDLKSVYALNENGLTNPAEMIGKTFKVLKVEEKFRNKKNEIGVLLFLENLSPSYFLYKQLYYMYVPGSEQPFLFNVLD